MDEKVIVRGASILADKILVAPTFCEIVDSKGKKEYYKTKGIHLLDRDDYVFSDLRTAKFNLYMPLSATANKNVNLIDGFPDQISLKKGKEEIKEFNICAMTFNKKIQDLTEEEKDIFNKYVEIAKEDPNRNYEIPLTFRTFLALTTQNYYIKNDFRYTDVVKAIARDSYKFIYEMSKRAYSANLRGKKKENFKMNDEQLQMTNKKYLKFLKSFDAFEIGRRIENDYCFGINAEGFEKGEQYRYYDVLLFKIADKTQTDSKIKEEIFDKVNKRKQELKEKRAQKKIETRSVSKK